MMTFFSIAFKLVLRLAVATPPAAVPPVRTGTIQLLLNDVVVATQRVPLPAGARSQVYVGTPYAGPGQAVGPVRVRLRTVTALAYCIGADFSPDGMTARYQRRSQVSYPQLEGVGWQALNAQLKRRYLTVWPTVYRLDDVGQVTAAEYRRAGFPVMGIFPANTLSVSKLTVFTHDSQLRLLCFDNDEREQVDQRHQPNQPGCGDSLYLGPLYYAVQQQRFIRSTQVLRSAFQRRVWAFAVRQLTNDYHLTPAEQHILALKLARPARLEYVAESMNGLVLAYCRVELKPGVSRDLTVIVSKELAAANILE